MYLRFYLSRRVSS